MKRDSTYYRFIFTSIYGHGKVFICANSKAEATDEFYKIFSQKNITELKIKVLEGM